MVLFIIPFVLPIKHFYGGIELVAIILLYTRPIIPLCGTVEAEKISNVQDRSFFITHPRECWKHLSVPIFSISVITINLQVVVEFLSRGGH